MLVGTCSECGRSYTVQPGRVQEAVKKHTESCREMQALDALVNEDGGPKGYRAQARAFRLPDETRL